MGVNAATLRQGRDDVVKMRLASLAGYERRGDGREYTAQHRRTMGTSHLRWNKDMFVLRVRLWRSLH
jgi:hypothetical protein